MPPPVLSEERLLVLDQCKICGPFFRLSTCGKASLLMEQMLTDAWLPHSKRCKVLNPGLKREGNGAPKGAFAFTLTKSPKDPLTVGDMLTAVRKVMAQKSCPVAQFAWYYEDKGRDENGDPIHPHIHGMYETHTLGRIEAKHWRRAWSVWNENKLMGAGFQGGYHRPVKSDEAYESYIKKDGGMSECKIE